MKVELRPREFHRRTAWAMKTARRGIPVVIRSENGPPLTLQVGLPTEIARPRTNWEDHFKWLRKQPLLKANPVDELRAEDGR
jgi:hypothetical protein